MRREQIALHPQQVAPPRGKVQNRFDADLILNQMTHCPGAHAHPRHGAVGHVHHIRAGLGQQRRAGQQFVSRKSFGRVHLHADNEFVGRNFLGQLSRLVGLNGLLFAFCGGDRDDVFGPRALRMIQRGAHGGNVPGRGAATTADNRRARGNERRRILAEILRRGRIHDAPADSFRPPGVGHHRESRARSGGFHQAENPKRLRRAAGAVDADDVRADLRQFCGHVGRRVSQQSQVVTGERHAGGDGQGADRFGGAHRFRRFMQVAHRFNDDQIYAAGDQHGDLIVERGVSLRRSDSTEGRQPDSQWPDRSADENPRSRLGNDVARQSHRRGVDVAHFGFEAVPCQLVAVCAEGVGFDDLRAGVNVSAMHIGHQGRLSQIQFVETLIELHAARVEHRSHRAVSEQRSPA